MDIAGYWQAVHGIEAGIAEPFVYIMSLDDPSRGYCGGVVTQVSRRAAARHIQEKSARLATPEEVEALRKQEAALREQYAESERRRLEQLGLGRLAPISGHCTCLECGRRHRVRWE